MPSAATSCRVTAIAVAFAMVWPALTAWLYFIVLADRGEDNPVQKMVYSSAKAVQFALPLAFVWVTTGRLPRPGWPRWSGILVGLAFGLLVVAFLFGLYYFGLRGPLRASQTPEMIRAKLDQFGVATVGRFAMLGAFVAGPHAFLEEYYYRWFVFAQLRRLMPLTLAVVLSSLAFMAHHVIILYVYFPGQFWAAAVPLSLAIAVGGAFWAVLYHRTASLMAAWISHGLIDLAVFVVGWDLVTAR